MHAQLNQAEYAQLNQVIVISVANQISDIMQ